MLMSNFWTLKTKRGAEVYGEKCKYICSTMSFPSPLGGDKPVVALKDKIKRAVKPKDVVRGETLKTWESDQKKRLEPLHGDSSKAMFPDWKVERKAVVAQLPSETNMRTRMKALQKEHEQRTDVIKLVIRTLWQIGVLDENVFN